MATTFQPKTLAKTLLYIACHEPGEHGLFWNADGAMPWKEFYWALQEDPSLRFIREGHIRELGYLLSDFPLELREGWLRLKGETPVPDYPAVSEVPARLFAAIRRQRHPVVSERGLTATSRPFIPLARDRELALRLGKRRDSDPVVVDILASEAAAAGVIFRKVSDQLYLAEFVPASFLILPPLRQHALSELAARKEAKSKKTAPTPLPGMAGSFLMDAARFQEASQPGKDAKGARKGKKGGKEVEWKRQSRKERGKRDA